MNFISSFISGKWIFLIKVWWLIVWQSWEIGMFWEVVLRKYRKWLILLGNLVKVVVCNGKWWYAMKSGAMQHWEYSWGLRSGKMLGIFVKNGGHSGIVTYSKIDSSKVLRVRFFQRHLKSISHIYWRNNGVTSNKVIVIVIISNYVALVIRKQIQPPYCVLLVSTPHTALFTGCYSLSKGWNSAPNRISRISTCHKKISIKRIYGLVNRFHFPGNCKEINLGIVRLKQLSFRR